MRLMRRQEEWNPIPELNELESRLGQLFGMRWLGGNGEKEAFLYERAPSCNIAETESDYHVTAELPGVDRKDVHVTMDAGVLTIRGERRDERETKQEKYHRRELAYGTFLRQFTMPPNADPEKIKAHFQNGLLEIHIAKSKAQSKKAEREIVID